MAVVYSPMDELYAHIRSSAQLFAPGYQCHCKVDLRRPLGTVNFDGVDARDYTTPSGFSVADTASGIVL